MRTDDLARAAAADAVALAVEELTIAFGRDTVVDRVSFAVRPGECLAIVGESGSGKTLTARALLGLVPDDARVSVRRLQLGDTDARGLSEAEWRAVRGAEAGLVSQDALVALDPLRRVGREVAEPLEVHRAGLPAARIRDRVLELLDSVAVPEPAERARQYPHELSGGLRQRALIASALAAGPGLLVADEPTTALDVTVQAQILALLGRLKESGVAIVLISHDLAVVNRVADRVAVMKQGRIVEQGTTADVLSAPQHEYTRALLAAVLTLGGPVPGPLPELVQEALREAQGTEAAQGTTSPALTVRNVGRDFRTERSVRRAVNDVSFELARGESLGIVGESGSGKTTLARILMGFDAPSRGDVLLDGDPWSGLPERRRRSRRDGIQFINQDPLGSFDPRFTVERLVGEALPGLGGRDRRVRVIELLAQVELGAELLSRLPQNLSGGQRQRVAIARALATDPGILVCDEPVSALDVQVQATILRLLARTRRERRLTLVVISHDLAVVSELCETVLVMKDGDVVERGATADVFARPRHPFTRELIAAVPRI
jgi:peptide/nickel transport system ATP-binding protein